MNTIHDNHITVPSYPQEDGTRKWLDNAALIAGRSWTMHGDTEFGIDISNTRFGGFFDSIVSVVTAPAKAVVSITKTVVNTASDVVKKIPVVGSPISKVLQVPGLNAISGVLNGQRIDKAVLGEIDRQVKTIREVAPLASSIVSLVPGVGTGVAAGIGAAGALISGQPIDQALLNAVKSAVPGGALGQAAFSIASAGVQGQNVLQAAVGAIPGTVLQGFPNALPNLKILQQAASGIKLADSVVNSAMNAVPPEVRKAFTIGIAVGQAQKVQKQTNQKIKTATPSKDNSLFLKYVNAGKEYIKKAPGYQQGLTTLHSIPAVSGYYYGLGVMSQSGQNRIYLESFRKNLTNADERKGFDLALSVRIGATTKVAPKTVKKPAQQFAYYATQGVKGSPTRVEQVKTVIATPEMRQGATVAVQEVIAKKQGIWQRFKEFFGFHGETESFRLGEFE